MYENYGIPKENEKIVLTCNEKIIVWKQSKFIVEEYEGEQKSRLTLQASF